MKRNCYYNEANKKYTIENRKLSKIYTLNIKNLKSKITNTCIVYI